MKSTILTKDQLGLFQFPVDKRKISIDQKVIAGIKKNATHAIILATGKNADTKIPYVDIRTWVMESNSEKWIMTPQGLRFSPEQYLLFYRMLESELNLLTGENEITDISHHLDEQALKELNQQTTTI